MTHFRPISLCNVLFNIMLKVLANKLQRIMSHCIDEGNSTFVPSELMNDNVIVAFELLHPFKRNRGSLRGNFALKLDMSKAYDRLE